MTDASSHPVIMRGRNKEVHTGDLHQENKKSLSADDLDTEGRQELSTTIAPGFDNDADYHAQLAYNEQPVTIRIERSSEKNAPKHADCYVNGRGAEILHDGKWHSIGYLPCGIAITTKRKYVEVLMRSRPDDCETEVIMLDGADPINKLNFTTRQKFPVSIIEDRNPIDPSGHNWAERIMSEQ